MTTPARTWLVGYDFSEESRLALARATEQLAALGGGTLLLVNVQPPIPDGLAIDLGAVTPVTLPTEESGLEQGTATLAEHVAHLTMPATITLAQRVTVGRPADTLVEVAAEVGADQIVIGSHGRRGLERVLLGSVAERVLRLADRPVLVVKAARPT